MITDVITCPSLSAIRVHVDLPRSFPRAIKHFANQPLVAAWEANLNVFPLFSAFPPTFARKATFTFLSLRGRIEKRRITEEFSAKAQTMRTHTPYRAMLPIRGRMGMRNQLVNPTAKVSHLGQQSRTIAREFLGDGERGAQAV